MLLKSAQNANTRKRMLKIFNMGIKNAEFYADINLVEVAINSTYKSYMKIGIQVLCFSLVNSFFEVNCQ